VKSRANRFGIYKAEQSEVSNEAIRDLYGCKVNKVNKVYKVFKAERSSDIESLGRNDLAILRRDL